MLFHGASFHLIGAEGERCLPARMHADLQVMTRCCTFGVLSMTTVVPVIIEQFTRSVVMTPLLTFGARAGARTDGSSTAEMVRSILRRQSDAVSER